MDDAGAAAFLAEMAAAPIGVPGEWFQMAIAQKSTNDLVGDIGVCRRDDGTRTAEIGFTMAPFAQGRGLGTEAVKEAATMLFAAGHVELIECITDTRNLPSIRLLERLGMRLKRTQDTVFKGEKCTEQVYSLILAQWNGILFTSKFRR